MYILILFDMILNLKNHEICKKSIQRPLFKGSRAGEAQNRILVQEISENKNSKIQYGIIIT